MSGVIGRIKTAAPLSCTSGFEKLSASNNGGFGLDWITDELMTVKRARRLYISLIISVWQRSRGGSHCRGGGVEGSPCRVPRKGIDLHTRARLRSLGLSHPLGAFNKSIQAIRGPIHVAIITGGWPRVGVCGGDDTWRQSLFNLQSSHQDRQRSREKKNQGRRERESEVLTEKSSGTGKSKTNPLHNLPL